MKFITRADGPYYLHHRPYHLCDLETPQSIAEAVLLGEVTVAPEAHARPRWSASPSGTCGRGVRSSGIGGHDWYGTHHHPPRCRGRGRAAHRHRSGGEGPARHATGEIITLEDVAPDASTFVYRLRMLQDALLGGDAEERR